jgi:uncharacterized peroxidase-related enzyme
MSRMASSIRWAETAGVLPPERPMMKWTRASDPSGKGRVIGGEAPLEDRLQVVADVLPHARIVAVARHEDDHRDEAVEAVDAHQGAHARTFAERQHGHRVLSQQRRVDLEQLVARIGFQHVDQRLAGMIALVEAGRRDDGVGLGTQVGDVEHGAGVGRRGEQADDAQFARQPALGVEGLDADVVEIGAAVHQRSGIGLGDDQRLGTVEEFEDLGRRDGGLGSPAQHPQIRIRQDAEAALVGALEFRRLAVADEAVAAHAEEGEVVVAQPFEKGDRLGDRGLVEGDRQVAVVRNGVLQPGQHRLPVLDRVADMRQNALEPAAQRFGFLRSHRRHVNMDDADAVALRAGRVAGDGRDAVRTMLDHHHRMGDEERLGGIGDLAHHRIEQEGHVVVDHRDQRDRPAAALHPSIGDDRHEAFALAVGEHGPGGERRRLVQHGLVIAREILCRCARQEQFLEDPAGFACLGLHVARSIGHSSLPQDFSGIVSGSPTFATPQPIHPRGTLTGRNEAIMTMQGTPATALAIAAESPLSDATQAYFAKCEEKLGLVPNVLKAYAFDEKKLRAFTDMYNDLMLGQSGLTKLEREMIAVAVSSVNHCYYCLTAHGAAVRQLSGDPRLGEMMVMNYRAADLSPRQKAMLDFAVKLTETPDRIEEADRQGLRAAGFSDRDIWDVASTAAFFNMSNRMAAAVDMRPNDEYHAMAR